MKALAMDKFVVGKDYPYTVITNSRPNPSNLRGYGPEVIGKYFITINIFPDIHPEKQICSFILTGSSKEYIFTCVYNDFKKVE